MNILGHAGLTLGAIYTAGYLVDMLSSRASGQQAPESDNGGGPLSRLQSYPKSVERLGLDFRMVLVGSLLPDIIDKPLGLWLMPEVVNFNARSVGHSLSFNIVLLAIALLFLSLSRRPLTLALASMGHLLFDEMWRWPEKLLWPLYGWAFPPGSTILSEWLGFQFSGAWLGPQELLGAVFLLWFAIHLYRQRAVLQFLRVGTLVKY